MASLLLLAKPVLFVAWSYRKCLMKAPSVFWAFFILKEIELARKVIPFENRTRLRFLRLPGDPLEPAIKEPLRTLDVLSVGSTTRPKLLASQLETWALHESIRSFIGVTEMDDHNQTCSKMSKSETQEYISSCKANAKLSPQIKTFAMEHYSHTEGHTPDTYVVRNDAGWHCAQRRFGQSLRIFEKHLKYSDADQAVPDYVVMVDDDSFFNAEMFQHHVAPVDPNHARIYAGCLFEANATIGIPFEFPYGGFGIVFSKGAVKRLITPIRCDRHLFLQPNRGSKSSTNSAYDDDEFAKDACSAIRDNQIGEQEYFQDGMTIVDLFSEYAARSTHFCLHSDWLIGYIAKYYLNLNPPVDMEGDAITIHPILTWPNQCGNHTQVEKCHSGAMFCHRQTPKDMESLTNEIRAMNPESFRDKAHGLANTNVDRISSFAASTIKPETPVPHRKHFQQVPHTTNWLEAFKSHTKNISSSEIATRGPDEARAWLSLLRNDTILQEAQAPAKTVWQAPSQWITPRQVIPRTIDNNELAHVFDQLRNGKILKATSATGGSQLKLLVDLEGGQQAIFKPKRESPGNDLHSSEISSFHVSRLLDMRRAPIAVGRRLDIEKEILPVASVEFRKTFTHTRGKKKCFCGTCEHCTFPVCPEEDGLMEGVMILMMPKQIREGSDLVIGHKSTRFPLMAWNDKDKKRVELMKSKDYCDVHVKPEFPVEPRILDIVETSIYDFLIQNIDRHTHEFIDGEENGAVLLIDQGKSFLPESADYDEMKILTPLSSCCILRQTTYEHLMWISRWDMTLSDALLHLTSVDIASMSGKTEEDQKTGILRDDELAALDRRLKIVLEAIDTCLDERGREEVLMMSQAY